MVSAQDEGSVGSKTAKASTPTLYERYRSVLLRAKNATGEFKGLDYDWGSYKAEYILRDIDKNGTPELLVHAYTIQYDRVWRVYTVKNGKVKKLGNIGTMSWPYAAPSGLYFNTWHANGGGIFKLSLKGTRLVTTTALAASEDWNALNNKLAQLKAKSIEATPVTNLAPLRKAKYNIAKAKAKLKAIGYSTGKAKKPAVRLTYNGKKLYQGTDYAVSYCDDAKYVVVKGKGAFKGRKKVPITLTLLTIRVGQSS